MGPYLTPSAVPRASLPEHPHQRPQQKPRTNICEGANRSPRCPRISLAWSLEGQTDSSGTGDPQQPRCNWRGDPIILSHRCTGRASSHRAAVTSHSLGQKYILGTLPSVEHK